MPSEDINFYNKHSQTDWWSPQHPFWALNLFNKLRIPFICNAIEKFVGKPVSRCRILDVGCGGGFLSEAMALKGANVLGIDTSPGCLQVANNHKLKQIQSIERGYLPTPCLTLCLEYKLAEIQDLHKQNLMFDAVIASEVVEHVANPIQFLQNCSKLLNPGGVLIITTPNRTLFSYLTVIFLAEKVLRVLPKNTHRYANFVKPKELRHICETQCGLHFRSYSGALYAPWPLNTWFFEPLGFMSYMMSFQKSKGRG